MWGAQATAKRRGGGTEKPYACGTPGCADCSKARHTLCRSCWRRQKYGGASSANQGGGRQRWADPAWRANELKRRRRAAGAIGGRHSVWNQSHEPGGCSAEYRKPWPAASEPKYLEISQNISRYLEISQEGAADGESSSEAGCSMAELSTDQRAVAAAVLAGGNVFFTGNAGTGKSHVLRQLVQELRRRYAPATGKHTVATDESICVTASTGIAAAALGGITLHSFAGVGLGDQPAEQLLGRLSKVAKTRWRRCRVLVIDEISMLDGQLLDKLDMIARVVRGEASTVFGGIQVVLCGDFFQLPPVGLGERPDISFAFAANCWPFLAAQQFVLSTPFRQADEKFRVLLGEVRHGQLSTKSIQILQHGCRRPSTDFGLQHDVSGTGAKVPAVPIKPTRLYPTNSDVDRINSHELMQLPAYTPPDHGWTANGRMPSKSKAPQPVLSAGAVVYASVDSGTCQKALRHLQMHCIAPARLALKPAAQVLLLKNIDGAAHCTYWRFVAPGRF